MAALLLECAAQIGDKGQEAVRVVPEWPGVAGPMQLVSQQTLGIVTFRPGPLGRLFGSPGSLPGPFRSFLGNGGAPSPVLGLSPFHLRRCARLCGPRSGRHPRPPNARLRARRALPPDGAGRHVCAPFRWTISEVAPGPAGRLAWPPKNNRTRRNSGAQRQVARLPASLCTHPGLVVIQRDVVVARLSLRASRSGRWRPGLAGGGHHEGPTRGTPTVAQDPALPDGISRPPPSGSGRAARLDCEQEKSASQGLFLLSVRGVVGSDAGGNALPGDGSPTGGMCEQCPQAVW